MNKAQYINVFFALSLSLSLFIPSLVLAQTTPPSTPTVISDYAKAVKEGNDANKNNSQAQQNQKDEQDNENIDTKEVNQEGVQEN